MDKKTKSKSNIPLNEISFHEYLTARGYVPQNLVLKIHASNRLGFDNPDLYLSDSVLVPGELAKEAFDSESFDYLTNPDPNKYFVIYNKD